MGIIARREKFVAWQKELEKRANALPQLTEQKFQEMANKPALTQSKIDGARGRLHYEAHTAQTNPLQAEESLLDQVENDWILDHMTRGFMKYYGLHNSPDLLYEDVETQMAIWMDKSFGMDEVGQ